MTRQVNKSASSGRFTSSKDPATTVKQTVGGKARGYRSASTGRFVSKDEAARNPRGTIKE